MEEVSRIRPRSISGFPELLPEEQRVFQSKVDGLRRRFESHGFGPIETASVEHLDILGAKNVVDKEVYRLARLREGDEVALSELGLHFDLTVPFARYVAQNFSALRFPFRRYQIQKAWRGERPQKGRFREFYQCDLDTVVPEQLDDFFAAEIMAVMWKALTDLGVPEPQFQIASRQLATALAHSFGATDPAVFLRVLDAKARDGSERCAERLHTEAAMAPPQARALVDLLDADKPAWPQAVAQEIDSLKRFVEQVGALGVPAEALYLDASIARGLDYYTGVVFETRVGGEASQVGSVCSGGRYDNLLSRFSNRALPGFGASIGLSRIFAWYPELLRDPKTAQPLIVAVLSDDALPLASSLAAQVRAAGHSCELSPPSVRLKTVLKRAAGRARYVALVGEDEVKAQNYTLRDLESGTQLSCDASSLLRTFIARESHP